MSKPNGRPPDPIRRSYRLKFGLTIKQARLLTKPFMRQLECCADDEARRLLLGVSK